MSSKFSKWIIFIAGIIMSITLPIFVVFISKWFYNIQVVNWSHLEILTYTFDEIKEIYSNIVNYCVNLTDTFDIGKFYYSEDGFNHFKDVRNLMIINNLTLIISSLIVILGCIRYCKFLRDVEGYLISEHTPIFWSAIIGLVIVGLIWFVCLIDFKAAFDIFHKVLFSGKTNWQLSLETDAVMLILPNEYFRNCGVFVGCLSVLLDVSFMVIDCQILRHRKEH